MCSSIEQSKKILAALSFGSFIRIERTPTRSTWSLLLVNIRVQPSTNRCAAVMGLATLYQVMLSCVHQFSVYTYRNMATQKLSRAQIKASLDQFPIESLLSSGKGKTPKLTTKQKAFAKAVALGETKANAYRQAYNPNPAPSTLVNAPYKVAKNARVQQEIEAIQLALSTAEHRQPAQIKALLIQQLLQHSIDEDFPPAQRVQCLKLLGSLYEVGAFMERKEVTTVKSSGDLRSRLLATLQDVSDVPIKDDALDLLAEISGAGHEKVQDAEPTAAPPAAFDPPLGAHATHTIPDIQSSEKSGGTPSKISPDEVVVDFDK